MSTHPDSLISQAITSTYYIQEAQRRLDAQSSLPTAEARLLWYLVTAETGSGKSGTSALNSSTDESGSAGAGHASAAGASDASTAGGSDASAAGGSDASTASIVDTSTSRADDASADGAGHSASHGAPSRRDLEERLGLGQSTVNRQVNSCIAKGLVEQELDVASRTQRLRATERGKALLEDHSRRHRHTYNLALQAIAPDQRTTFVRLLAEFSEHLAANTP